MRLLGTSLTILVVGFAAGGVARLVLPRWTPISWSGSTLAAIVGSGLAGAASEPFVRRPHLLDWRVALASLAGTVAVVAVAGAIRVRTSPAPSATTQEPTIEELIAHGESGSLEFKSSPGGTTRRQDGTSRSSSSSSRPSRASSTGTAAHC